MLVTVARMTNLTTIQVHEDVSLADCYRYVAIFRNEKDGELAIQKTMLQAMSG